MLFKDDKVSNTLESLAGTLKAAKKRGIISYKPELLLQGMSDNEVVRTQRQNKQATAHKERKKEEEAENSDWERPALTRGEDLAAVLLCLCAHRSR